MTSTRKWMFSGGALLCVWLLANCSENAASPDAGSRDAGLPKAILLDGDRPAELLLPGDYDASKDYPLVLLLHPWTEPYTVERSLRQLGYHDLLQDEELILALPQGTASPLTYWNATPACCGGADSTVDDVRYLTQLIDEISASYSVDQARVFVVGRSNGGFMAHRLACDAADKIAAIVSLAGAGFLDAGACRPSEAVSILQVHGDADSLVNYAGGRVRSTWPTHPGAEDSVMQWAVHDGCDAELIIQPKTLDLDADVPGADTRVEQLVNCPTDIEVALWTIEGGDHWPDLSSGAFARASWKWLAAHPKN